MSTLLSQSSIIRRRTTSKLFAVSNQVNFKRSVTKLAISEEQVKKYENQLKEFETISKIQQKYRTKKPQKPPFAKNLFLGIFDTDILTYPEVLQKDEWLQLNKDLVPIQNYFEETNASAPKQLLEDLSRLNVIGVKASQLIGGREMNDTESCTVIEALSASSDTTGVINSDHFGLQMLLKSGSDQQKAKYLERLTSGSTLSAFCLAEADTSDLRQMKAEAVYSSDKKTWVLNGEKTWVINGNSADIFIVFAKTEALSKTGLKEKNCTVFIVDRSFGGIMSKSCEASGLASTDIANIRFNNTPIPEENILGVINEGESILSGVLTEMRLSLGPVCITMTKKLLNRFIEHCKFTGTGVTNIADTEAVGVKIAKLVTSLYAMESMTYLTASLMDQYENQDCQLEAAMTKVFATERCFESAVNCTAFIGTAAYMKDHWCNKFLNDALSNVVLNETNDNLKLVIALLGLQHTGANINDTVKMMRNPLFFPGQMFKRLWTQRGHAADNPKLTLGLGDYLHPSAVVSAQLLEYSVLRLQFASETLLGRYGPDVVTKHIDMGRLAQCIIDIYAATAVLARASRSYCIGLRNSDYEILIANAFTLEVMERVKENVLRITKGPYNTNDVNYNKIAEKAIISGKYFLEHPLERNF